MRRAAAPLAAAFLASGVTGALSGFRSELWIICSIIGLHIGHIMG